MNLKMLDRLVRKTMPGAHHPDPIDPYVAAHLGELNPARFEPDSLNPQVPSPDGTYKLLDPDTGDAKDTGVPYRKDGQGNIQPIARTPAEKKNLDGVMDAAVKRTESFAQRLQRQEVARILAKDRAEHNPDGSRKDGAIVNSYKTEAERDIEFERRVLGETGKGEVSVPRAQELAAELGLIVAYIQMTDINGRPQGIGYVTRGRMQYGPTTLDQLVQRLEIDVEEKRRTAEKVAEMEAHSAELNAMNKTSYWMNGKFVSGERPEREYS